MYQNICSLLYQWFNNHVDSLENFWNHLKIASVLNKLWICLTIIKILWVFHNFIHLVEALAHFVNIVYVAKYDLTIPVVALIFESATLDPIGLSVELRPRIKYHYLWVVYHRLGVVWCSSNLHEHVFVIGGAPTVALHALGAPPDWGSRFFVVVGKDRQSTFCPELGTTFHLAIADSLWNYQKFRVSRTKFETLIMIESKLLTFIQINTLTGHFTSDVRI